MKANEFVKKFGWGEAACNQNGYTDPEMVWDAMMGASE